MTTLYQDDLSPEQVANLHRVYCAKLTGQHGDKRIDPEGTTTQLARKARVAGNSGLRIGYVTGDLHRQHPVNIFMLPLLQQQRQSSMEVYIYHTGKMHDQYTERARLCADQWLEAASLDDGCLHQKIVQDEIDVLIDLSGHTASHRLGVFTKRAAPAQVTFLGYPHSTGLACMDFILGDAVVSPLAHQHLFTERIMQLAGSVFCWSPVDDYPLPAPRPLAEPFVLGSFNNALKLSPNTIALWARILNAIPQAILLLKAPSFRSDEVRARFCALFQAHGVDSGRLMFRGPSELGAMMQEYGDIDVALDPLPYNGGTTSLQALWMGVPLVTLEGGNFVSRMGSSFLQSLGCPQWIAQDESAYVDIVMSLARAKADVRLGRAQLRSKMEQSVLCDIAGYARSFEKTLRTIASGAK